MTLSDLMKIAIGLGASALLGLTIAIMFHYIRLPHARRMMQMHIFFVTISYTAGMVCITISTFKEVYPELHAWHVAALLCVTFGLMALVPMFKHLTAGERKRQEEIRVKKQIDDIINKNEK